ISRQLCCSCPNNIYGWGGRRLCPTSGSCQCDKEDQPHITNKVNSLHASYLPFFSIFAQVSFRFTVRLRTGFSVVESLSTQKYPRRSNWKREPTSAVVRSGST